MQLSFDVTQDDFVAFAQYYYKHTAEGKRGMRRMYLFGLILVAAFAYSETQNAEHGLSNPLQFGVYVGSAVLVLGGLYAAYLWYLRPTLVRMMCRGATFQEMLGPTTLTFDDRQIVVNNNHGTGRMEWSGILEMADTPDYVFLITGMLRAFIIPKRCFENADQAAETVSQLRTILDQAH